ncbi:MAG: LytR/AlgR family response regulator transcription factor, partial [Blautia sp.]
RKKDKKAKIIYVTAYDDFREYAFSVHAFAYLVKPLDGEKIRQILKEAMEYTEEEADVLLGFETETGFRKIGSRDILYLEYRNRKVRLVTLAGEFWLRESIGAMEKRLAPYGFYMPHKSFVVNFFHVKNLKGYDITMSDGSLVPLSQKKSSVFREELAVWLSEQI